MDSNDPNILAPQSRESQDAESSIDWVELISILWSSRKLIATVTGVATTGALVVSLLLPKYYQATGTLLPETGSAKVSALARLADLASLAGISIGPDASVVQLYPAIISSEAVLRSVLYATYVTEDASQSRNLIEIWEIGERDDAESFEEALEMLRASLMVSVDRKNNVVTISYLDRDPKLAADVVNKIVEELDSFIRTKQTTSASEQRKWIASRLEEVGKSLEAAEDSLKVFRERNRRIGDSPQLLLEQGRLMREIEINSVLYEELKKQFEIAKIEEVKNIAVVTFMDRARPPVEHASPRRRVIVVVVTLFALTGSMGYILLRDRYSQRFAMLRFTLSKKG